MPPTNLNLESYIDTWVVDTLTNLRKYCKCFADTPDNELWQLLYNVIGKISNRNCWAKKACDTFLLSDRTENITFNIDECKDCNNIIKTALGYDEVDTITSASILVLNNDGTQSTYIISSPQSHYIAIKNEFRFNLDTDVTDSLGNTVKLSSIDWGCCEPEFILILNYTAGYRTIPDCLWEAICKIMQYAILANNNCSTENCATMDRIAFNAYVTQQSIKDSSWNWQVPDNKLEDIISSIYSDGINSSIFCVSNCAKSFKPFTIKGVKC